MINIAIIDEDFDYIKKMTNLLSNYDENFRVCNLINKFEDNLKFKNIDIIFANNNFMKKYQKKLKKYQHKIILVFNTENDNCLKDELFYIYKSYKAKDIVNIIYKVFKKNNKHFENEAMIKDVIKKELKYLGYNPKYCGTRYLLDVVYILLNNGERNCESLEKNIYPIIARKYNKDFHNIKCNIVNATDSMICECEEQKLVEYLGFYKYTKPGPKKIMEAMISNIYKNSF